MTSSKRAVDLVRDMSPTRPAEGAERRRSSLKTLLGTEDGGYQLVEAKMLPLGRIVRNPNQPRQTWDDETLRELADSIIARGILQPIRVRRQGDGFEIVAGERRYRAAHLAGLTEIPAIVVEQEDAQAYIDSLIENVQREDLNPLDRAEALRQLRANLGSVPWAEVGAALGLSERSVFHLLNLQTLPEEIKRDVRSGELTEKHGRALHRLRQDPTVQQQAYETIVADRLTGDEALRLVQRLRATPAPVASTDSTPSVDDDPEVVAALAQLQLDLGRLERATKRVLPVDHRRALANELVQLTQRLQAIRARLAD